MAQASSIEWTDATWNPVRGCTKISAGCKNCYAKTLAERFAGVPNHPYEQGFKLRTVPSMLQQPLDWKTPKKIFVNSMSDLFHPDVPTSFIGAVTHVMMQADWHTYQVLTKRADRLEELMNSSFAEAGCASHIWWGVSVENKRDGLPRIEHLRRANVQMRFLSVEPLLEDLGEVDLSAIDWVIVGGESGNGARPMEASWVDSIQKQCAKQRVPFFFKQWGGRLKSKAGRLLHGRTYDQMPSTHKLYAIESVKA